VLIYQYTEKMLDSARGSIRSLDARLGTAVAFAGLLLRFAFDLPPSSPGGGRMYWVLLGLKGLGCALAMLGLGFAAWGFMSRPTGHEIAPEALLEDWYREPEAKYRLTIIRTWAETIDDLKALAHIKSHKLNWAVLCLAATAVVFGLNVLLDSFI